MDKLIEGVKGKKIAVALSGGVDSSVCALLLKKSGAEIFGITMKTIPSSSDEIERAKIVAKKLEIPHYIVDLGCLFEKEVIDYFVDESSKGKNPNPCVRCNQKVKFGALLEQAEKLGAELMATGHYAKISKADGHITLERPVDVKKDQSYVMSMLPKEVFLKLIFPLGDLTKNEVKNIAKENGLLEFDREESKDLCFLDTEKGTFIEKHLGKKLKHGNIVDKEGNILGVHNGIVHYTIGQSKKLGLNTQEKFYVKEVHPKNSELVVGKREDLYSDYFYVENLNWVSIEKPDKPFNAEVIIRNKMAPVKATIFPQGGKAKVVPEKPVWAVSPGQLAAFIRDGLVLGGGWIA